MNTTSSTHFLGKVTQKAIIVYEGKVLLSRDVGDTQFELPGGRLDMGEDPRRGPQREIREELGIKIEVQRPVFACKTLWGREKIPHYFVAFEATLCSPLETVRPDGVEVEEMKWVHPDELGPLSMYQECVDAIRAYSN
jgi:8-oxo-dGTP diphosphatase